MKTAECRENKGKRRCLRLLFFTSKNEVVKVILIIWNKYNNKMIKYCTIAKRNFFVKEWK